MELFSQNNHHQKLKEIQDTWNTKWYHHIHNLVTRFSLLALRSGRKKDPGNKVVAYTEEGSEEGFGCMGQWGLAIFLKIVEYVTILTTNLKSCIVVSIKSKSCQQLFIEYSIKKQHWNTINTVCMQYSQSGKSFFYTCLLNVSQIERLTNNTKQGKTVGRYWKFQIPKAWEEKQSQC